MANIEPFQIWWKKNFVFYPKGSRTAARDAWKAALASHAPSEAAAQPTRDDLINLLKRISTDIGQTIIEDPIRAADGWVLLSAPVLNDIQNSIEPYTSCRNPNHALVDGSSSPHEIGPSCMAESEHDH